MDSNKWERLAPLTGIAAPILWVLGIFITESGDVPNDKATAEQALAYFTDDSGSLFLGFALFGFGVMAFVWFLGSLRTRLLEAEAGSGRLTAIAFAGGMGVAIGLLATFAPQLSGAIALEDKSPVSPEAAQALWLAGTGFFAVTQLFAAVFLFAVGLVSFRYGALPKWLAWAGVVLGVLAMILPIGWIAVIIGLPLWVLTAAVWLYRAGASTTPPAVATPVYPPLD